MEEGGSSAQNAANVTWTDPTHTQDDVKTKEERLVKMLGPIEPFIMHTQSVLVWENPRQSLVMMLAVNAVFWLATITSYRCIFLASSTVMIVMFIDAWKNKIWPEIRVPPSPNQDLEEWTPVHPKLLSVPELCHHMAEYWVYLVNCITTMWSLRQDNPAKFCLMMCGVFTLLATVGHYVPGIMVSYIIVMSILMWPCVVYHNVFKYLYINFEPIMMRMEYKLKIRRHRRKKGKKSQSRPDDGVDHAETDSETDLDSLSPSFNPDITAALARAITDSEDESSLPSRRLSKDPSLEGSDVEDVLHRAMINELSLSASLSQLTTGAGAGQASTDQDTEYQDSLLPSSSHMPSFSHDDDPMSLSTMQFYPSHFNGDHSDTSDIEDSLAQGLKFASISQDRTGISSHPSTGHRHDNQETSQDTDEDIPDIEADGQILDTNLIFQNITQQVTLRLMTQTLTNMASSTLSALGHMTAKANQGQGQGRQQTASTSNRDTAITKDLPVTDSDNRTVELDEDTVALATDSHGNLSRQHSQSTESDLADFEMLDEEELAEFKS